MASSAGRVVLTFDVDDKGVVTGLGKVRGEVDEASKGITAKGVAMGAAFGTFVGGLAVDAVKALGREIMDIGGRGIQLAPVVTAFQNLTSGIGLSGDAMLAVSRDASKGLITDLDLMAASNKAIMLGLPVTNESMGTMAQAAVALGKAMNQGATKSFDDLITALGRSSPMILDNLGLSVKVGEANEKYAKSIGKAADQLTDSEKKLAFYNAAMDAAKVKVESMGGIQLTLADRVLIAKNQLTNFTDALGVAIATSPVMNSAFESIGLALGSAMGENQTQRVQSLTGVVNKLAIGAVSFAQVMATGAEIIIRSWNVLKVVITGALLVVAGAIEGVIRAMTLMAQAGSKIPGIGSQFDGLASSLGGASAMAEGMRQSFQEQVGEAWEGVKGNDALSRTVQGLSDKLGVMKAGMIAASGAQADTAEIARQLTTVTEETAGSTEKAAEAAKKLAAEIDKERAALSALGLVTERDVNKQMDEFQKVLDRATKEGVPLERALAALLPKLVELRQKAKDSGTDVAALDDALEEVYDTIQDLNGGLPTMNNLVRAFDAKLMTQGLQTISMETVTAGHNAFITKRAYETLGVDSQASLVATAAAARIAYADILASGTATERRLIEARGRLEKAEIDAGLRTVSLWQTNIEPAIKLAGDNIVGSLATNFTDMLTGATGFKDGFVAIWGTIKDSLRGILDAMLQTFLKEFLGGMMSGLNGWAAQAGKIFGSIFSQGQSGMMAFNAANPLPGMAGGSGAAAGAGIGATVGTTAAVLAAPVAAYALGKMASEWAGAFFGWHGNPGVNPEDMDDSGRNQTDYSQGTYDVPAFDQGGVVRAGSGMLAALHGHEAIMPLPDGFDLAGVLSRIDGARGGMDTTVEIHTDLGVIARGVMRIIPGERTRLRLA